MFYGLKLNVSTKCLVVGRGQPVGHRGLPGKATKKLQTSGIQDRWMDGYGGYDGHS